MQQQLGLAIIKGFAVFECASLAGTSVASARWWNVDQQGAWVDFTPRLATHVQLLLVETSFTAQALGNVAALVDYPNSTAVCEEAVALAAKQEATGVAVQEDLEGDDRDHSHDHGGEESWEECSSEDDQAPLWNPHSSPAPPSLTMLELAESWENLAMSRSFLAELAGLHDETQMQTVRTPLAGLARYFTRG